MELVIVYCISPYPRTSPTTCIITFLNYFEHNKLNRYFSLRYSVSLKNCTLNVHLKKYTKRFTVVFTFQYEQFMKNLVLHFQFISIKIKNVCFFNYKIISNVS